MNFYSTVFININLNEHFFFGGGRGYFSFTSDSISFIHILVRGRNQSQKSLNPPLISWRFKPVLHFNVIPPPDLFTSQLTYVKPYLCFLLPMHHCQLQTYSGSHQVVVTMYIFSSDHSRVQDRCSHASVHQDMADLINSLPIW